MYSVSVMGTPWENTGLRVQVGGFRVVVRRLKIESAAELYTCGEAATTTL